MEGQRERRRLDVVELGRRRPPGPSERLLGEPAERLGGDADDPLAHPFLGARSGGVDRAADVHAEGERRLGHHGRDAAAAAGDVTEVERGGADRHPDLAGARLGHLDVLDLDHVGRLAVAYHPGCSHSVFPGSPPSCSSEERSGGDEESRWGGQLGDDPGEERTHPRGGRLAGLEDLLVVERLAADAGGQVGDQADPEDLHARLAGGDRLEGGAHADQLAAEDAGHPDLGRGLVVRPGELHVDALVEARVHLAAQRAQPGAVEVGQVDEVRPHDRRAAGEVDVVADQHRRTRRPGLLEPAAAVGEHDGAAARLRRRTHAVHDRRDALALVVVGAAEEDQRP